MARTMASTLGNDKSHNGAARESDRTVVARSRSPASSVRARSSDIFRSIASPKREGAANARKTLAMTAICNVLRLRNEIRVMSRLFRAAFTQWVKEVLPIIEIQIFQQRIINPEDPPFLQPDEINAAPVVFDPFLLQASVLVGQQQAFLYPFCSLLVRGMGKEEAGQ